MQNKPIFTLKKNYYLVCELLCEPGVNYRMLHVKQPDVVSGVWPETKPLAVAENMIAHFPNICKVLLIIFMLKGAIVSW